MKDVYYIKTPKVNDPRKLSGDDLIQLVDHAADVMKLLAQDYVADPATEYGLTSNGYERVKAFQEGVFGGCKPRYRKKEGSEAVALFRKDLQYSAIKNGHFINNVKNDRAIKGMWFYNVQWEKGSKFSDPKNTPYVVIVKTSLFDGATCEVCGTIIESKDTIGHRLQKGCFDKQQPSSDYVRIDQGSSGISMSTISEVGTIPYLFAPITHGVFVPSWVKQAFDVYQKNQGYAGLTLVDYLKKIASSHNE